MISRNRPLTLAATLAAAAMLGPDPLRADSPPAGPVNVLWIVVDDMGYGDLSGTGRTNYSTPNIDRLGREGVTMERAYVYPVCTPTRAALLTGYSPQKYGLEGVLLPGYEAGLPPGSVTAAKEFKAAGYRTGLIGKWHLGDGPEAHPNAQGFDDFFGFLWGETGYYSHTKQVAGIDELDFFQNGTKSDIEGYTTDLYGSRAVSFLRENRSSPFFLALSFNAPHYYLEAPQEYIDQFTGAPGAKLYAAVMKSLDDNIGRVLDELDRLGLDKNTLVVFTTDNGAPNGDGHNAPFSGHKGSLMEGGIRSPLMARLPGVIPRGRRCDQNFAVWDLLPTALSFAGLTPSATLEGKDRKTLFTTAGSTHGDPLCFRYTASGNISRAVVKAQWKLHFDEATGLTKLFDLAADPGETADLASGQPAMVSELKSDWNAWSATFSPNLGAWN
jgi:arylsulfatase A-like enzyme